MFQSSSAPYFLLDPCLACLSAGLLSLAPIIGPSQHKNRSPVSHLAGHQRVRTSAALAAALLASPPSLADEPPNFWPWLLILGTEARGFDCGGGAESSVRPGWEKGSFSWESLPHRLPIVCQGWGTVIFRRWLSAAGSCSLSESFS